MLQPRERPVRARSKLSQPAGAPTGTGACLQRIAAARWNRSSEVGWLAERLADPPVAIVDTRSMPLTMYYASFGREQYLMGHIPGAIHLDYVADLRDSQTPYAARVAPPHRFADAMRNAGIGNDTNGVGAAGAYVALRTAGFSDVAVYDGSLADWTHHNLPTVAKTR